MTKSTLKDNIVPLTLSIITVIAITFSLYVMKPVLVPFVFSVFLFFTIYPVIDTLRTKANFNKTISIAIGLLILLAFFSIILLLLGLSVRTLIQSIDIYTYKLIKLFDEISIYLADVGYKGDLDIVIQSIQKMPIFTWIQSVSGSIVGLLGNSVLVIIFTFFLIIGKETEGATSVMSQEVSQRITRYLMTKLATSALTGLLVGITFTLLDVQMALMFGMLSFFLNFIPNVGSIIAVLLPLPIVFLQFGSGITLILSIIIPGIIQFSIGNILDPKLMGENLGLHPVIILLSLLFWGFIWGVPGMFLSVPMTAIIKMVLNRSQITEPIAMVLEGKLTRNKKELIQ